MVLVWAKTPRSCVKVPRMGLGVVSWLFLVALNAMVGPAGSSERNELSNRVTPINWKPKGLFVTQPVGKNAANYPLGCPFAVL